MDTFTNRFIEGDLVAWLAVGGGILAFSALLAPVLFKKKRSQASPQFPLRDEKSASDTVIAAGSAQRSLIANLSKPDLGAWCYPTGGDARGVIEHGAYILRANQA